MTVKRGNNKKPANAAASRYIAFAIVSAMVFMLCLTINYRAFTELSREAEENQNLTWQIQNLTNENLDLQEEIHTLKTDPQTIMREAQKMGLTPARESKVPVQANR
ncbi:MAG: hypothetical protein ACK4S4_08900 [Pyrinomonadaceae bacterium]